MATLYTQQSSNRFKTFGLLTGFFLFIIAFGFVLSQYFGNSMIVMIAVAVALVSNVVSYWYSDSIALSLSHAQPLSFEADPELYRIVENLSITAGLPMPRLYLINDSSPNAFATGRDPKHAAIAVTSGLRALLDRSELEGVIAHELSHIGNRDILVSTVVVVMAGVIAIASDMAMRAIFWGGGRGGDRGKNPIIYIIGLAFILLSPIAATIIRMSVSRKREFLADATGALMTRYPEGLASALRKISGSKPLQFANNATAHLFISNPFGARGGLGISRLFMTHPPVEDRIAALLGERASPNV